MMHIHVYAASHILILVLVNATAYSQEYHDSHHWWYRSLKSNTGVSCCNKQDCGSSNFRSSNGKLQIAIHGRWCDIDESRILKGKVAPDRGTHVCAPTTPIKGLECLHYCVVLGTGS